MANEIQLLISLTYASSYAADTFNPGTVNITQNTQMAHRPIVIVNTSAWETVPFGDIGSTSLGIAVGRNLHTSNYVDVGVTTGSTKVYEYQRIKAGEPFSLRLFPGRTYKWKANTTAVKVDLRAFQD